MHNDINIIVAVDEEGGFGKKGKIPWHYKEDFKHFQETTKGHICVMGRKTYDDMAKMAKKRKRKIKDSILPNRTCYVLSNSKTKFKGATHVESLRRVAELHPNEKIFVLGGAKLFQQALSWVNIIYMTVIDINAECDRFFPINILKDYKIIDGKHITTEDETDLYIVQYKEYETRNNSRR